VHLDSYFVQLPHQMMSIVRQLEHEGSNPQLSCASDPMPVGYFGMSCGLDSIFGCWKFHPVSRSAWSIQPFPFGSYIRSAISDIPANRSLSLPKVFCSIHIYVLIPCRPVLHLPFGFCWKWKLVAHWSVQFELVSKGSRPEFRSELNSIPYLYWKDA